MKIVSFEESRDFVRLASFLRDRYLESRSAVSWLPARLHDLVTRIGAQEAAEGRPLSADHICMWEENGQIAACILPDGENVYVSIRPGFASLFPSMLSFSEAHCRPLFPAAEDGSVKFWFAVSDSLAELQRTLAASGYSRYPEAEYMTCVLPAEADTSAELPAGFRFLYGEEYPNDANKWSALRLGFHPEWESPDYRADMGPYLARKRSSLYRDSFECLITDEHAEERNDVCAYCFVYIDKATRTALIEPVSTRQPWRRRGLGTALMRGAIRRCKALGIQKCYVDAFGWRREFYAAAGFSPEDSISFWYKTLR